MCGQDIVCEDCGEESAPGLCLEAEDQSLHTNAPHMMSVEDGDEQSAKADFAPL